MTAMHGSFARRVSLVLLAVFVCLIATGCSQDVGLSKLCEDPDFDCYFNRAVAIINGAEGWLNAWIKIHLALKIAVVTFGILATVMIALTDQTTHKWAKPIGLIASALATGLTAGVSTFQVPENIDRLADNIKTLKQITNAFDTAKVSLVQGATNDEIMQRFKTDDKFREAVNALTSKYVNDMNNVETDMVRVIGITAKKEK
jgi:hypothetical protein